VPAKLKKKSEASLPRRLPYANALRTFAYANRTYEDAMNLMASIYLAPPPPEHEARARQCFDTWRAEARIRSKGTYAFSAYDALGLHIDPLYTWINCNNPSYNANETVNTINRVLDDLRLQGFRKILDILLYAGSSPEEVHQHLKDGIQSPVQNWTPYEVSIYQEFFWDTALMSGEDWNFYLEGMDTFNPLRGYVTRLRTTTVDVLRHEAIGMIQISEDAARRRTWQASYMAMERVQFAAMNANPNDIPTNLLIQESADKVRMMDKFMIQTERTAAYGKPETKGQAEDIFGRLRVLITERERHAEGVSLEDIGLAGRIPVSVTELDGSVSDPRNIKQPDAEE
jgi:hypothetical protein